MKEDKMEYLEDVLENEKEFNLFSKKCMSTSDVKEYIVKNYKKGKIVPRKEIEKNFDFNSAAKITSAYLEIVLLPFVLNFTKKNIGRKYALREIVEKDPRLKEWYEQIKTRLPYRALDGETNLMVIRNIHGLNRFMYSPSCAQRRRYPNNPKKKWGCREEDCNEYNCINYNNRHLKKKDLKILHMLK